MTELRKLPILPTSVRLLNSEESSRLDTIYPNLPRSLEECPTCYGKKKFRWFDGEHKEENIYEFQCPCADQFRLFKYFLNLGVGRSYQTLSLYDIVAADPKAITAIGDYAENAEYYLSRGMGMLFYGNHGTGKTLLSTILFKQLVTRGSGIDGFFTTFTGLMDNFVSGWRDDKTRQWFDKRVRNAKVLVVDDIGKELKSANHLATAALDSVFRSRVQNALPTIITTNLSLGDFRTAYSSGVMSLLEETSLTYEFTGSDWRVNQGEKNRWEASLRLTRPIVID